jgi:hypothetical protein
MSTPERPGSEASDGVDYFRNTAWEAIAPGFQPLDSVLESLVELAEYDDDIPLNGDQAAAVVRELWHERETQLAAGPRGEQTDDAKVIRAFDRLAEVGLVFRMSEDFDQGDAVDECTYLAQQKGAHGFAFFHDQDAARLAHPDADLYIGFDAVPPAKGKFPSKKAYDDAAVAVGQQVVDALRAEGLEVEWDGRPTSRPVVRHLDWRRPLPES